MAFRFTLPQTHQALLFTTSCYLLHKSIVVNDVLEKSDLYRPMHQKTFSQIQSAIGGHMHGWLFHFCFHQHPIQRRLFGGPHAHHWNSWVMLTSFVFLHLDVHLPRLTRFIPFINFSIIFMWEVSWWVTTMFPLFIDSRTSWTTSYPVQIPTISEF